MTGTTTYLKALQHGTCPTQVSRLMLQSIGLQTISLPLEALDGALLLVWAWTGCSGVQAKHVHSRLTRQAAAFTVQVSLSHSPAEH